DDNGREDQSDRNAHLRPACPEAAIAPVAVLKCEQDGAAPLTTDSQSLAQAQEYKNEGRCNAEGGVAGQESNNQCRDAHQQKRGNQRGLTTNTVAKMSEECTTKRTSNKADEESEQ